MNNEEPRQKVGNLQISPNIDAGHIMQALVMVATALVFGAAIYYGVISRLADHDAKLMVHDQRLATDEAQINRISDELRTFSTEMRQKADLMLDKIGEVRDRLPRPPTK